jgi:glutamate/tyrosine decarboxylase-like PLP-dependent enzyme
MIGEFLASSVSNPGFSWICSPACTELEQVVLDWCAKMFGLDDGWLLSEKTGGGIIIVCQWSSSTQPSEVVRPGRVEERALH